MTQSSDDNVEHSTVGRQSSLSQAQQDVVREKFPKWEKILRNHNLHLGKLDRDGAKARDPEKVTDWLDQTVQEVKSSPVFDDFPDTSKKLTKTIEAMFRNYRNNTFIKRNQHDIVQAAIAKLRKVSTNQEFDASKAAEALVCFKSPGGAKQIFRAENEEKIHEEMARMRAEAAQAREAEGRKLEDFDPRKEDNGGAFYQRALTALWKAADQDAYEKKARGHDLFKNQEKFPSVIKTALEALCENGALGPMEILFMSGFRNEHNELVLTRLSCHSGNLENPTQPGFLRSPGEELLSATLTRYWCEYCEAHIPRHAIPEEFDRDVESAYISTNSSGIPVLLEFNLYDLKPIEIGKILRKFLNVSADTVKLL
ncbi:hypothetical protein EV360DRAFT_88954 [Lentinula raphanica]|nr:hypothetical protein EV360DRAFT_88954 [Lentinula raphanica]